MSVWTTQANVTIIRKIGNVGANITSIFSARHQAQFKLFSVSELKFKIQNKSIYLSISIFLSTSSFVHRRGRINKQLKVVVLNSSNENPFRHVTLTRPLWIDSQPACKAYVLYLWYMWAHPSVSACESQWKPPRRGIVENNQLRQFVFLLKLLLITVKHPHALRVESALVKNKDYLTDSAR